MAVLKRLPFNSSFSQELNLLNIIFKLISTDN